MNCSLALDLGTKTGYALGRPGLVTSGTADFKPGRFDGGGMRYLRFRTWLGQIFASVVIGVVLFEEVRMHQGVDAAHVYGGLLAHLTAWCEEHETPYQGVPVKTIKKYWTGNGNAGKPAMIDTARMMGFQPQDDNEADAIALLHWHMAQPGAQV